MSRETPPPTTGEPIQGFLSWIRDGDFHSGGNMVLTRGRHAAALAYRSAADCRPPFPALVAVMLGSLLLGCSPDLGDPPPDIGDPVVFPEPVLQERSLVWTQPEIVDDPELISLARVMAAASDDEHGGLLFDRTLRRFGTTEWSTRVDQTALADEMAVSLGEGPPSLGPQSGALPGHGSPSAQRPCCGWTLRRAAGLFFDNPRDNRALPSDLSVPNAAPRG